MKIKIIGLLIVAFAMILSACGGKSDADLAKAVNDKLAADKVTGVTAAVKDGVVTLTGEVADITVKNKAEAAAKVEGVKSVTNNLSLKPLPPPPPPPVDPMLKGKVEENLKKAGCTGVAVEVGAGKVTVKGTVPDAKYAECVRVVNESGATGFDNQLTKGK